MTEYERIIDSVFESTSQLDDKGNLATYIPELACVDPNLFGVNLTTVDKTHYSAGDSDKKFSIQSISKVLSLALAYSTKGEKIWERVGVEPSGNPFNSLFQLEADGGIPRNPFINSGAIVVCDILLSTLDNPKKDFLEFVSNLGGHHLEYNISVSESEKSVGFRNIALCNFIKSLGNIHNDPSEVLDLYFNLCSLEMTSKEVSESFLFLADKGRRFSDSQCVLTTRQIKRINAVMQTCGFYDESGEFAFNVGLPGKSGVGGGIMALHPNEYVITVWSPKLNKKGNSYKGLSFLEQFTTATKDSIF